MKQFSELKDGEFFHIKEKQYYDDPYRRKESYAKYKKIPHMVCFYGEHFNAVNSRNELVFIEDKTETLAGKLFFQLQTNDYFYHGGKKWKKIPAFVSFNNIQKINAISEEGYVKEKEIFTYELKLFEDDAEIIENQSGVNP